MIEDKTKEPQTAEPAQQPPKKRGRGKRVAAPNRNFLGGYVAQAYELLDASISWSPSADSGVKVSIWGKNLTNEKYALTATFVSTLFTNLYQALPRRYGAEVTYRF